MIRLYLKIGGILFQAANPLFGNFEVNELPLRLQRLDDVEETAYASSGKEKASRKTGTLDWPLAFWLICVSGLFFDRTHNPYSIPYFMEGTIILSSMYVAFWVFVRRQMPLLGKFILLFPVLVAFYSASMAALRFGQPLLYGLIEERRVLLLWCYFPLLFHAKNANNFVENIIRVAIIIIVMGYIYRLGLFHGIKEIIIHDGREGRANFSSAYVALAILASIALILQRKGRNNKYVVLIFGITFLSIVAQTRSVLFLTIFSAFSYVLIFRALTIYQFIMTIFSAWIFLIIYFSTKIFGFLDFEFFEKIFSMFSLDDSSVALRYESLVQALEHLNWLGNGALSELWQEGFHRFFGPNFFLSDIGIVGTIYRFGGAFVVYMAISVFFLLKLFRASKVDNLTSAVAKPIIIFLLVFWVPGSLFMYRGEVVALLAAFVAASHAPS